MTRERSIDVHWNCRRCGHSSNDHRLDDSLNISPGDPGAPFRCLGPELGGCDRQCPDMVGDGPVHTTLGVFGTIGEYDDATMRTPAS